MYSWFWTSRPAARTDQREVHEPVVVHAPLDRLVRGARRCIRSEHRAVGDRITPGDEHLGGVAVGDHDLVEDRCRDGREPEEGWSTGWRRRSAGRHHAGGTGADETEQRGTGHPAEHATARDPHIHDVGEVLVVGWVDGHAVIDGRHGAERRQRVQRGRDRMVNPN